MSAARACGALASVAMLLNGCGWSTGLVPPAGVRTVGLEMFANETPEPDLEPVITRVRASREHGT